MSMNSTNVPWADRVWNPVTGCSKISEGCQNCYAENFALRVNNRKQLAEIQGVAGGRFCIFDHEDGANLSLTMRDSIGHGIALMVVNAIELAESVNKALKEKAEQCQDYEAVREMNEPKIIDILLVVLSAIIMLW